MGGKFKSEKIEMENETGKIQIHMGRVKNSNSNPKRKKGKFKMSQHTPGPWMHTYHPNGSRFDVVAPKVSMIVNDVQGRDNPEAEANARLIAAAPEMVAALRALCNENGALDFLENATGITETMQLAIDDARALLAKIEGQA